MTLLPPGVHADFPAADRLTPLFRQYLQIKEQQPGALLLYRLGDFYELFGQDALRASQLLGLTLTARQALKDYKVAMCGVPHHSAARYIKRMVEAGEMVALCEQLEDPAQAKGLVERGITRVITAGTLVEDEYLAADSSNFLVVLAPAGGKADLQRVQHWGLAVLESSGGRVELREESLGNSINQSVGVRLQELAEMVLRHHPAELLLPAALAGNSQFMARLAESPGLSRPAINTYHNLPGQAEANGELLRYFAAHSLEHFGLTAASPAVLALWALLRYLKQTFRAGNLSLHPSFVSNQKELQLDHRSVKHLSLLADGDHGAAARGPAEAGLYGVLNRCTSAAGKRLLKSWLLAPCADLEELGQRQETVEHLFHKLTDCDSARRLISELADLERIVQRVGLRRSHPKELAALASSLPRLAQLTAVFGSSVPKLLARLVAALAGHEPLMQTLHSLLAADPPLQAGEGACIRAGADAELDQLRDLHSGGSEWFRSYEESLRSRTGIRTLKVRHTGPSGWFIEVSKAQASLVPTEWERRGTLVNAERYSTAELREREAAANSAQFRLAARERELLEELYAAVESQAAALSSSARAAAQIDLLCGLATLAREEQWCRCELVTTAMELELEAARHPLVEAAVGRAYYAPNDCYMDQERQQVLLLTGPNMGGKSSYLRMLASLVIINQLAGFVPARRARLPLFDRIFTRIGAHDLLARGQSTFMVEMLETARILRQCTAASLIVLDEVGRGTSTYDGISIAKAVLEFLHEHPERPLTLFATHFFELTDLAGFLPRVANFQVEVASAAEGEGLVFTYRVITGAASDSFGIEVARQAGLPPEVVSRAAQVLAGLEETRRLALEKARSAVQLGLFSS